MVKECHLFKGNWLCDTQHYAHWVDTNKISWKLNMKHLWDVLFVDIIWWNLYFFILPIWHQHYIVKSQVLLKMFYFGYKHLSFLIFFPNIVNSVLAGWLSLYLNYVSWKLPKSFAFAFPIKNASESHHEI